MGSVYTKSEPFFMLSAIVIHLTQSLSLSWSRVIQVYVSLPYISVVYILCQFTVDLTNQSVITLIVKLYLKHIIMSLRYHITSSRICSTAWVIIGKLKKQAFAFHTRGWITNDEQYLYDLFHHICSESHCLDHPCTVTQATRCHAVKTRGHDFKLSSKKIELSSMNFQQTKLCLFSS